MSVKAMAWAWEQPIPATEKFVLLALADYYNEGEKAAWPKQSTLAARTSLSMSTVRRCIKSLAMKKLITVYARRVKGVQYANWYELSMNIMIISGVSPGVTVTPSRRSHRHPAGGHSDLLEPLVEPLKEPLKGEGKSLAEKSPMKTFGMQDVEDVLTGSTADGKLTPTQVIAKQQKVGSRFTVAALRVVWASLYSYHDYGFLPEWTMKEKGQINQLQKKLGDLPILRVLAVVMSKWHQFTAATTMYKPPKTPDVGFLLKNVGTAGDMYLQSLVQPVAIKAEGVFEDMPNLTKTTGKGENKTNADLLDDLDNYDT
jgi:hypothetical protein